MADPYRAPLPWGGGGSDHAGAPLSLHVAPVHPGMKPESELTTHAVVRIRAERPAEAAKRPMLSAVLVVDVSGSMRGEPIAQVLHSAKRLAEILDDTDRLGLVTFADGAETAAALRPLGEGRRELVSALGLVTASGGTNIAGGLAQASLLFPRREQGERQLLVLLSDGEPNIGPATPAELGAQARLLKARDVAISTLGYGANHHDDVLSAIADGGGGRYTFVIDPKLAEASFIRALGAQLDVVAERVELLLAPGPDVEILRVLEDPPTAVGAGGLRVTLSDLVVGDELNIVVELRVRAPREVGPLRALNVTLSCHLAGTAQVWKTSAPVDMLVTRTGSEATDPAPHALVSIALAAETRVKARALSDRGSFADAEALLRRAQAMIAATPGFVVGDSSALADAYETLADEILVMAKRPARMEYEQYRKVTRDQGDFLTGGTKTRGSQHLVDMPPSSRALHDRAMVGTKLPRAFLRVLSGPRAGLRVAIAKERFLIGRGATTTDLMLPDANVSRQHSLIELVVGAFWLVDLGSTNGPIHKGERVARLKLTSGDEFTIGDSLIRYEEE